VVVTIDHIFVFTPNALLIFNNTNEGVSESYDVQQFRSIGIMSTISRQNFHVATLRNRVYFTLDTKIFFAEIPLTRGTQFMQDLVHFFSSPWAIFFVAAAIVAVYRFIRYRVFGQSSKKSNPKGTKEQ